MLCKRVLLGVPGTSHHRARSTEPHGDSDDADSAHWGARSSGGPDGRREGTTDIIGPDCTQVNNSMRSCILEVATEEGTYFQMLLNTNATLVTNIFPVDLT